jgi:hypothetical protein
VIKNFPAALVVLIALVTTTLVHAVFAVWWMVEAYGKAHPPRFDWVGSLATSGIVTALGLVVALVVYRLVGGTPSDQVVAAPPARPTARPARPASEVTVIVPSRHPLTSA